MMAAILLAPTLLIAAVSAASTAPREAPEEPLLLFTDDSTIAVESRDPRLELRNHQPAKGPLVITPTEPWEGKVFAYNHVIQVGPAENRIYYDCIESAGEIRRICLATSTDGLNWIKPDLGVFNRNGR